MDIPKRNLVDELNRCMPAAAHAQLGTRIDALEKAHNALLAKLDADAGVTDTDYVATLTLTPLSSSTEP